MLRKVVTKNKNNNIISKLKRRNNMEISQNLRWAINEYKNGNNQAFTYIYEESKRYIYTCIYKIFNGNENGYYDISDVMNETYLEICQKINQLQDDGKFLTWAGTIASRKCLEYLRRNNRFVLNYEDEQLENIFDSDEIIPENILVDREQQRILREIIDTKLTEIQKLCLISYYYNEQKQNEIAENLGIPENTVKTHLSRAKKTIKENVLSVEKSTGTRFYSLSPVLLMLLSEELMSVNVPEELAYGVFGTVGTLGGTMAGVGATAGQFGQKAMDGMGASAGTTEGIGGYVAGNQAGAIGGYAQAGSQTGAMANAVAGNQMVATGAKMATGAMAKVVSSGMKAKIISIALGTVAVLTTGGLIYNATHKDEDTTTEISTEISTEEIITEASTEIIEEATTETPEEEVELTKEEEEAVTYMALSVTSTKRDINLDGMEITPSEEFVWEYVIDYVRGQSYITYVNYGPMINGVQNSWLINYDDIKSYGNNVFGISTLNTPEEYSFEDLGNGNYLHPLDLLYFPEDVVILEKVVMEEDIYVVSGNIELKSYYYDDNMGGEVFDDDGIYDFEMRLIKNENSPTGFTFISIKYEAATSENTTEDSEVSSGGLNSSEEGAVNNDEASEESTENVGETINGDIITATSIHTTIQSAMTKKAGYEELMSHANEVISFTDVGLSVFTEETKALLVDTLGTSNPLPAYTTNGATGYAFMVDSNGRVSVYISSSNSLTEWTIYSAGSKDGMSEEYAQYD